MFSYLLEVRSREEERLHDEQARDIHHRIASAFAAPNASLTQVPETLASMTGYIAADGIATYQGGEITLTGVTPTKEEFLSDCAVSEQDHGGTRLCHALPERRVSAGRRFHHARGGLVVGADFAHSA